MAFQIKETPKQYDVVIVGSGAGGGMAANVLSQQGLKIALLEAGPNFDPANPEQQTQFKWPYDSPRRGASTKFRAFGEYDMAYGGWNLEGEPYTQKNGSEFYWFRSRMLGGRTNHWGRISLRFGPLDFKRKDFDGKGDNWPISYNDVSPYYDKVDKLIGVFGTKENIPNEPDGYFLPPPKPRLHELLISRGAKKAGIPIIPSRLSILTRRINKKRQPCFYCNQCNRACMVYGDFSSGSVLINPAMETGNVDLYVNAMVHKVTTNDEGLATGVSYIDKESGHDYEIRGKVVVLAASACSSARILLNSKSKQHPNGLANSSDHVGKYLHDSTGAWRMAYMPELFDRKRYNEDGVGGMHVYTPWWLNGSKNLGFTRGYHIEYWGGMGMPGFGTGFGVEGYNGKFTDKDGKKKRAGGYGSSLKEDVYKYYGSTFGMSGRGESIPQKTNYCELDPNTVDKFGIPVLRFNYKWTDEERMQAKHMHETFEEIFHKTGAVMLGEKPGPENDYGLDQPGKIIHEVGTTRMGNDPKTSVTNKYSQCHDVKNLFVADGGVFVSQADKNPTWTILALAWRASDYITDQIKQQNL